jgi:hypothetical protein
MPRTFCYDEAEDIFYIDGMGYTGAFFDAVKQASTEPQPYILRRDDAGRVTFEKEAVHLDPLAPRRFTVPD